MVLNPTHLETLRTVLQCGSFADAGRQLDYTASAVSQQMAALERHTQLRLFERDAQGIRPTPAARQIADAVPAALGGLRRLETDIARIAAGRAGQVRLGAFPSLNVRVIPAALASFARQRPTVELRLWEGEPDRLLSDLEARDLDVVVAYSYADDPTGPRPPDGTASHLTRDRLLLLSPARDAPADALTVTTMAELSERTWIAPLEDAAGTRTLRRLCASAGFEPQIRFRSNNYAVAHELVANGFGNAIVPALSHRATAGVVAVDIDMDSAHRDVFLVHSRLLPDAVVEDLRAAIVAALD